VLRFIFSFPVLADLGLGPVKRECFLLSKLALRDTFSA